MMQRALSLALLLLAGAALATGCKKSSSSTVILPPGANMSGVWQTTSVCNETDCGGDADDTSMDRITVFQDGSQIMLRLDDGQTLQGTMAGLSVTIQGTVDEGSGQTTSNLRLSVSEDGRSFSGDETWTYVDATSSCGGTCALTGMLTDDPAIDASGTWELDFDCNEDCGSGPMFDSFQETWTLSQTGADVSAETLEDGTLEGTMVGFTVVFDVPVSEGTASLTLTIHGDGESVTGVWAWQNVDGCTGSCTVTGQKTSG